MKKLDCITCRSVSAANSGSLSTDSCSAVQQGWAAEHQLRYLFISLHALNRWRCPAPCGPVFERAILEVALTF